jgi:probable phosphoglycerate mutase
MQEVDMGEWEGRTYDDVSRNDSDAFGLFLRDPGTYGYPGGESLSEVCRRAMRMLHTIAEAHDKEHVLVVAHKQTIRTIVTSLQSLPLHRARDIEVDPGSISLIRTCRGSMELNAVNWAVTDDMLDEETKE